MLPLLLFFLAPPAAGDLSTQFAEIARAASGKVGVSMMVLETGERASYHGNGRFPMQSVYKFPIAMAALRMVDEGKITLEQKIPVPKSELAPLPLHSPIREQHPQGVSLSLRELVRFAVSESDGTASDVLLRVCGGPAQVMYYLDGLGITGVRVVASEADMARNKTVQYRNWASPDSMVELLQIFHSGKGLSASNGKLLENFMAQSTPGPKRIKGLLPAGTRVAHKTGTSGTDGKLTAATNDVGIVTLPGGRHLAIAVFVSDSKAEQTVREATIAKLSLAAWDHCQK
jgi:beta-lactamase class A